MGSILNSAEQLNGQTVVVYRLANLTEHEQT